MAERLKEKETIKFAHATLTKQGPGHYISRSHGEVVGELRLAASAITMTETYKGLEYISPTPHGRKLHAIRTDLELTFVYNPETLRTREIRTAGAVYNEFKETDKSIVILDKITKDGEEFFHYLRFNLDESSANIQNLLSNPSLKKEWEKIRSMKPLT